MQRLYKPRIFTIAYTSAALLILMALLVSSHVIAQQTPLTPPVTPTIELLEGEATDQGANPEDMDFINTNKDNTQIANKSEGFELSPNDYKVDPNFNPSNLPTEKMRTIHRDWWTAYNQLDKHWQSHPAIMFGEADIDNWRANGSYTVARQGGNFLYTIVDLIRTTGDPKALLELIKWSTQIRTLVRDHDGRGYPYFEYTAVIKSDPEDGKHNLDDTQWLDEHMLGGALAHIAHVMHVNRDYSGDAGVEADYWFKYLDENWLPKWLYRTTYGTNHQYTPPSDLNLQNAVNWDGGIGGTGGNDGDIKNWGDANVWDSEKNAPRFNDEPGITHIFPAHMFAHPYIMSILQYQVMGQYFQETGKKPVGAYLTGTAKDYLNEAKARHDWWHKKVTFRSDGSTFWPHFLSTRKGTQVTATYSMYVSYYLHALHWMEMGRFASGEEMRGYSKIWYNGSPASNSDILDPGNVNTMRGRNDGTGGERAFSLKHGGLLGCWDDTGTILALNDKAIISPTSHILPKTTSETTDIWHHNIHHNTILSCELKNYVESRM